GPSTGRAGRGSQARARLRAAITPWRRSAAKPEPGASLPSYMSCPFHHGSARARLGCHVSEREAAQTPTNDAPELLDAGQATYKVPLPAGGFEGPLDLLLHLCQKHELDILDIPIAFVTEKYLEYLAVMQLMNLDVAAEYLLMAATLAHIKSKMLL